MSEVIGWYYAKRDEQRARAAKRPPKWRPVYRMFHESSRYEMRKNDDGKVAPTLVVTGGTLNMGRNKMKRLRRLK